MPKRIVPVVPSGQLVQSPKSFSRTPSELISGPFSNKQLATRLQPQCILARNFWAKPIVTFLRQYYLVQFHFVTWICRNGYTAIAPSIGTTSCRITIGTWLKGKGCTSRCTTRRRRGIVARDGSAQAIYTNAYRTTTMVCPSPENHLTCCSRRPRRSPSSVRATQCTTFISPGAATVIGK